MKTRICNNFILLACALTVLAASAAVATAASKNSNYNAVKGGAHYIKNASLNQFPGTGFKADAVSALAAARKAKVSVNSKSRARFIDAVEKEAVAYLGASGPNAAARAGKAGKLTLAATANGKNPRCFGSSSERVDLIAIANSNYISSSGQFGKSAFDHALAMLALKAAHEKVPSKAVKFARERRGKYGWNFALAKKSGDDIESTALMIQALRAAGVSRKDGGLKSAYRWITYQRNVDGGYNPGAPAAETQADATAYAIMAADSLGINSSKAKRALRALQKSKDPSGAFRSTPAADPPYFGITTVNAVIALGGSHFPVVARSKKGVSCA